MKNRIKLHQKLRHTIIGTAERPRLSIYRSLNNVFLQLIDDQKSVTLAGVSTIKSKGSLSEKAKIAGTEIAKKAKELKIANAVYDRGGFQYHGAIKIACEAAREEGLTI